MSKTDKCCRRCDHLHWDATAHLDDPRVVCDKNYFRDVQIVVDNSGRWTNTILQVASVCPDYLNVGLLGGGSKIYVDQS